MKSCMIHREAPRRGFIAAVLMLLALIALLVSPTPAVSGALDPKKPDITLKNEVDRAYHNAFAFLKSRQNPDGSWSSPEHPALTGLVTYAFLGSREYGGKGERPEFLKKSLDFILRNAKENGAIFDKELPNYNTAICIMALMAAGDPAYHPYIVKGRRYLVTEQDDKGVKGVTDQMYDGGVGYGTKDHPDLSNTYMALEALRLTEAVESDQAGKGDLKTAPQQGLNWEAALKFIERCQNLPAYNDQKWASDDAGNKGGFVYFPGNSKAGEETLPNGNKALRSYGSMTYAGLLSLIYADLNKEDPRVTAAYDWIRRNYTLEENPGMGQEGLFYYYHTMAKALTVMGRDVLETPDGRQIDWRKALTERLIGMQKGDGFWVNDAGRWWENDPVLVTAYALIAMNMITPSL